MRFSPHGGSVRDNQLVAHDFRFGFRWFGLRSLRGSASLQQHPCDGYDFRNHGISALFRLHSVLLAGHNVKKMRQRFSGDIPGCKFRRHVLQLR